MLCTEYEFELPFGYLDESQILHKRGVMRLATAADEILPLRDSRCKENEAYLIIILLSRVITRLGTLQDHEVNPKVIERIFARDIEYLREFYNRINQLGQATIPARCPKCEHAFEVGTDDSGVIGYPLAALHEEVAFVSYHFHWSREEVLALEHPERKRWVEEISAIHQRMNTESGSAGMVNLGMP